MSLGRSLFKQNFSLKVFVFILFYLFVFFIKISKLALPGVILKYERGQYRKKR